jgi:hypothetical protein
MLAHQQVGQLPGCPVGAQHRMDEGASGAAVAVGERVDGLELCVGDRSVHEHRDVVAPGEAREVGDGWPGSSVVRRSIMTAAATASGSR